MVDPLSGLIFICQASPQSPGYELFLLVAGGSVVALLWPLLARRRHARNPRGFSKTDQIEELTATRAAEEVREVLRELQGSVREIESRLDGKIRILEDRIAEAKELERRLSGHATEAPEPPVQEKVLTPPDEQIGERVGERERTSQVEIERLADEGRDAAEIARLTGRPMGEVEVILALKRHQRSKTT